MSRAPFAELQGKTLIDITGLDQRSDRVTFECSDGTEYLMWHSQDCCETVCIEEVTGDVADLLNSPILLAEEVESEQDGDPKPSDWAESWRWTFYKLSSVKGSVTIRWLGESNGYYSESVDFERVEAAS